MTQSGVRSPADDSDAVVSLTQHIFDTFVEYFEQADLSLPKRRMIVVGSVDVFSDEGKDGTFAVMFGGVHVGLPGSEMGSPVHGDAPSTAVYNIELWRPVTTGRGGAQRRRAPRPDTVSDEAKVAMSDAWTMLRAAYGCDQADTGITAQVSPLPPQGGMQGSSLTLSIVVP